MVYVYVYVLDGGVYYDWTYVFLYYYARRWMSDIMVIDDMCVCIVVSYENKII